MTDSPRANLERVALARVQRPPACSSDPKNVIWADKIFPIVFTVADISWTQEDFLGVGIARRERARVEAIVEQPPQHAHAA
jgi:hypothetical protein